MENTQAIYKKDSGGSDMEEGEECGEQDVKRGKENERLTLMDKRYHLYRYSVYNKIVTYKVRYPNGGSFVEVVCPGLGSKVTGGFCLQPHPAPAPNITRVSANSRRSSRRSILPRIHALLSCARPRYASPSKRNFVEPISTSSPVWTGRAFVEETRTPFT